MPCLELKCTFSILVHKVHNFNIIHFHILNITYLHISNITHSALNMLVGLGGANADPFLRIGEGSFHLNHLAESVVRYQLGKDLDLKCFDPCELEADCTMYLLMLVFEGVVQSQRDYIENQI